MRRVIPNPVAWLWFEKVWGCGRVGGKTKMEDRGSKIDFASNRLAILDHPSSIPKPSPILPHPHPPTQNDNLKATLNFTDLDTGQ